MEALHLGLSDKERSVLDRILEEDEAILKRGQDILTRSAELSNRTHDGIELYTYQVLPVLVFQVTKQLLNGFSPGLGKTFSSCASYALYRMTCIKDGKTPSRLLVVTENAHVEGMQRDFRRGGVHLATMFGGNKNIEKQLSQLDEENFSDTLDGIVTTWDSLKTNSLLMYLMENRDKYQFGIFDETARLMSGKGTIIYKVAEHLINKYQSGMSHVMFLNGTNFAQHIYDVYHQFQILAPKLIPNKRWIDDNFVVKETKDIWRSYVQNNAGSMAEKYQRLRTDVIVDYKNHNDFRESLKYYYIYKNKNEVADEIPVHNYKLHMIPLTPDMKREVRSKGASATHWLNSPATSTDTRLTRNKHPKFDHLLNRVEETIEDRPVIYCWYREAMYDIQKELEKMGYRTGIINGELQADKKQEVIDAFNSEALDVLILNVGKSINIPSSNRMIFYSIPGSPKDLNQIKARIDRNNYDTPKFYDFLCYADSQEVSHIAILGYFREKHGTQLTGQGTEQVYKELVQTLKQYYTHEQLEAVGRVVERQHDYGQEVLEDEIMTLLGVR